MKSNAAEDKALLEKWQQLEKGWWMGFGPASHCWVATRWWLGYGISDPLWTRVDVGDPTPGPPPRPSHPSIPGGWSVCFREGTQVHTENGLESIETISCGKRVWAYDHDQRTWELMPVIDTEAHDFDGAMVMVKVGEDTIVATTTHPFWVVSGEALESRPAPRTREGVNRPSSEKGRWVAAGELRSGDVLLSRDGQLLTVVSAKTTEMKVRIHNLMVDRLNNYAVGKAGLLVNNM